MSTSIGMVGGRGGMNRGMIAGMMAMLAASSPGFGNNVIEIKAAPDHGEPLAAPMIKLSGMSPRNFARYRNRCGHPKRKKNLHHCARLAKVKARRA